MIEFSRSYSNELNKYSVVIYDFDVLEGKANNEDIIEAAQIDLRTNDVTIN